jgi:hypothetical protein
MKVSRHAVTFGGLGPGAVIWLGLNAMSRTQPAVNKIGA